MFDDGTFPTDYAAVTVLADSGIKRAELKELGNVTLQRGCTLRRNPKYIHDPLDCGQMKLSVFQKIKNNWMEIDGTKPWSVEDEAGRYLRGPSWKDNSCAVDCIMVIALLLNAGRCQADQSLQGYLRTLTEPARILLYIISKPWKELSDEAINKLRDIIVKALYTHDPNHFPQTEYKGITDTFYALLAGLPQLSYTLAKLYKYNNNGTHCYYRLSSQGSVRSTKRSSITMSSAMMDTFGVKWGNGTKHKIGDLINRVFQDRTLPEGLPSEILDCEKEDCSEAIQRDVVLDRLPPVMVLSEDWHYSWMTDKFSNFRVSYLVVQKGGGVLEKFASYEPLGCVINVGGHFVLNWNTAKSDCAPSFIHYDGLRNYGKFQPIQSLNFRMRGKESKVSLLFYRLIFD